VKAQGPAPKGRDFNACYDSKRDRIYMSGGIYRPPYGKDEGYVYIYDVKTSTWSNPPNGKNAVGLPTFTSGMMHYDAVNDRVVVFTCRNKNAGAFVSVYDPETGDWSEKLELPAGLQGGGVWHGFYDRELNAHFVFVAGDSVDNGVMWAYRYKGAPGKN